MEQELQAAKLKLQDTTDEYKSITFKYSELKTKLDDETKIKENLQKEIGRITENLMDQVSKLNRDISEKQDVIKAQKQENDELLTKKNKLDGY